MVYTDSIALKDFLRDLSNSKPVLLVYKGFNKSFIEKVPFTKLIDGYCDFSLNLLWDNKIQMLPSIFMKVPSLTNRDVQWCTYEEFITVNENNMLSLYFEIIIVQNNLYHQIYPILYTFDGLETVFNEFYANEEYVSDEDLPESLELVSKYYGNISRVQGQYFISYIESEVTLNFFDTPEQIEIEENFIGLIDTFITEDELSIAAFTHQIENSSTKSITVGIEGNFDDLTELIAEKIALLNSYCDCDIRLVIPNETTHNKFDDLPYLSILEKYWGHSSFRLLKMYENIHNIENPKKTYEISQAQIIHNLVEQAELAKAVPMKEFKDIFVTSPTGAGKSVMFQIPAIYLAEEYEYLTIVISPLIGLMKDQVEGMESKAIHMSATINSEVTPVEKMNITEKIASGEISILYISPETLLSRSDIKMLIGERKIGLFIIDEAHIVTTWGKAFRSDYWYLGGYLSKLRKELIEEQGYSFPIATFTATSIYAGVEDMFSETRDGLGMISPIRYFGYVKRDDLTVNLKRVPVNKDGYNEYLADKYTVMLNRLQKFMKRGEKTLIYFPMISFIHQFKEFLEKKDPELAKSVSVYYGTLTKENKNENFLKFRTGDSKIMLATKAFGMGIDIPDINNVYHFAPTGNVCDYIQEIGRAARDLPTGNAYFDFFQKDFMHVNRLHGISTIRQNQLIQVMDKIIQLAKVRRPIKRNLLVSAEEFRYIFDSNKKSDFDDDIDNKLKTALLIIEKDFISQYKYSPIVARPRSVFSREFFTFPKEKEQTILKKYSRYLTIEKSRREGTSSNLYGDIYRMDMKMLWEDKFNSISFSQFKFFFHAQKDKLKLQYLEDFIPILQIELMINNGTPKQLLRDFKKYLDQFASILSPYALNNKFFSIEDIAKLLMPKLNQSYFKCENLANTFIQSLEKYDSLQRAHRNFYTSFIKYDAARNKVSTSTLDKAYTITQGFDAFINETYQSLENLLNRPDSVYSEDGNLLIFMKKPLPNTEDKQMAELFLILGILEACELILYKINGGEKPEIYIRINSLQPLENAVLSPARYKNRVLKNVRDRHLISTNLLTYLFEKEVASDDFWNYIEDYFLGIIPDEVNDLIMQNTTTSKKSYLIKHK
ncbi:DEAD/DEAH box helicase [Lysinibacillus sp. 1P01SD]|uniref:DEAD/DEAH box helicase n=1 Tax=Lysinibacillus sp. 1P01SD TaxID=3132285 RepID=UPI0039A0B358